MIQNLMGASDQRSNQTGLVDLERLMSAVETASSVLCDPEIQAIKLPPAPAFFSNLTKQFRDQARHATQRYTVLLLGEFNAGKSTFLNALLGLKGDERLLVGDEPLTAKPTRCTYRHPGDPAAKWIHFDDREEVKESWREALPATVERNEERTVREVILFIDHPLLRATDFLDMPGTGAAYHKDHSETTRDYIASSELVLWVVGPTPSFEGKKDIRIAADRKAKVVTIFNAWGYLNAERDRELRKTGYSQEDIEHDVRQNFPTAFIVHPTGLRVFAGKCCESIEAGSSPGDLPAEFGLQALKNWLADEYFTKLPDAAEERRRNVREQVVRICATSAIDVADWIRDWEASIERDGDEGKSLSRERSAINRMEHVLQNKVRLLAKERADAILRRVQNASEAFIEAKLRVENFELLRNLIKGGPDRVQSELSEELQRDYLKLEAKPSWLDSELQDFIREAWVITEAEWRRFLEEIPLESPVRAGPSSSPSLPFDEIGSSVKQGIASVVQRIVAVGTVIGVLLAIPGAQVVDAIGIVIALGVLAFHDPLAKPRQNAIRRIRSEIDLQRTGLKNQLQDEAMGGGHASLKAQFNQDLERRVGKVEKRTKAKVLGLDSLRTLHSLLTDAGGQS